MAYKIDLSTYRITPQSTTIELLLYAIVERVDVLVERLPKKAERQKHVESFDVKLQAVRQSLLDNHWLRSPVQSVREKTMAEIAERDRRELADKLLCLRQSTKEVSFTDACLSLLREGNWRKGGA